MWKFTPIYKDTIWGGRNIAALKGLDPDTRIGEMWMLSGVDDFLSTVSIGPDAQMTIRELIEREGPALLGKRNLSRFGNTFPLLIKIIDADADLSVQVHPDDDLARARGGECGKTEMWYLLPSAPGARLANGFCRSVSEHEFPDLVSNGRVLDVLRYHDVHRGDVFYVPAGRVHTIGAGCTLVEVQQTSDDTYRIYDFGRRDDDGNPRPLHLDLAMQAIDFNDTHGAPVEYTVNPDVPVNVVRSPYFTVNVMAPDGEIVRDYSEFDTFVIIIGTQGRARITAGHTSYPIKKGELVLLPARTDNITIQPDPQSEFTALEVYINS